MTDLQEKSGGFYRTNRAARPVVAGRERGGRTALVLGDGFHHWALGGGVAGEAWRYAAVFLAAFLLNLAALELALGVLALLGLVAWKQGLLTATFQFFEELGSARVYHLLIEDIPVSVMSDQKMTLTEGDRIGLGFAPSALHVFDGASGRSLLRAEVPAKIAQLA